MNIRCSAMHLLGTQPAFVGVAALVVLSFNACGGRGATPPATPSVVTVPPAVPRASNAAGTERAIRFLEDRVRRDPDNFIVLHKLATSYLQRLRETGSLDYLDLASRAARASLEVIPAEQNKGGLAALAMTELTAHDFAAARDHAMRLAELDPGKSYPYMILGDALLELGDYDKAAAAFRQMERMNGGPTDSSETRLARLAVLRGDGAEAQRHFSNALVIALDYSATMPPETIAWYYWQLGETAFTAGDYETAERHYRDALVTFPDDHRVLASTGRVRAARGDLQGAIEQYERAIRRLPDPAFVAALGDLYKLAGRDKDAAAQYALVEQIGHLSAVNGALYNRQLALFYADHDMKAEEAYANATREYEVRRDIYGADALAWTALKAGRVNEAQAAIKDALRLGTQDARLFYHAGMIARAAGDGASSRKYLQRALTLNPQFDLLQAEIARKALGG